MDIIKRNVKVYMLEKRIYIKPITQVIIVDIPVCHQILSGSGNILHDANTQKDHPGPEFGGDEPSDGGDLDAAKRSGFNFSESDTNIFK